MEDPRIWDRLTCAVAEFGITDPGATWNELVARGLVVPGPARRVEFERIVRSVTSRQIGPGPSTSYAVAQELHFAGVSTSASSEIVEPSTSRRDHDTHDRGSGLITRIRRVLSGD